MSESVWNKPVLSLYHENNDQPEREAFAVIKARKLTISKSESGEFKGNIVDFFCLMGDVDQVEGSNKYVVCWFDDSVEDFYAGFRRLSGVTFPGKASFTVDKRDKRTYNTAFQAKHAKLK
ncbi:MAG: hypothetical protein ACM3UL_04565 [Ignavibacteria bacterium]